MGKRAVGPTGPRSSKGCELETLEELVSSTGPGLVRYAARLLGSVAEAEDAVQESYVKAFDALAAGRFDGRSSLRTWLYRIVTRTAIDQRRSRARREKLLDTSPDGAVDGLGAADAHIALRELEGLLDELPDEQRSALVLQSMEGFTNREIGEIQGSSEGAVEQRLVRARAALKTKVAP